MFSGLSLEGKRLFCIHYCLGDEALRRERVGGVDGHLVISYILYMLINLGDYTCRVTEAHFVSILCTLMNGNIMLQYVNMQ